jgi:hypothetical protein
MAMRFLPAVECWFGLAASAAAAAYKGTGTR